MKSFDTQVKQFMILDDVSESYNYSQVNMFRTIGESNRSLMDKLNVQTVPDIMPFSYGVETDFKTHEKSHIRNKQRIKRQIRQECIEDKAQETVDELFERLLPELIGEAAEQEATEVVSLEERKARIEIKVDSPNHDEAKLSYDAGNNFKKFKTLKEREIDQEQLLPRQPEMSMLESEDFFQSNDDVGPRIQVESPAISQKEGIKRSGT